VLELFHPVIQDWFRSRFAGPTEPQAAGWAPIAQGAHTLIAAPTGSGKTLTAFLAVIDRLFRQSLAGTLEPGLQVVYVSPLRALSNDMQRNLSGPLQEIQETAERHGLTPTPLRTGLRTGDTSASQRAQLVRRPPHILVTTPESLYLMLTSEKGRAALSTVNTVIVDEIHALVRDKRGSHLSLSLERLQHLTSRPIQRIGLSATQKPITRMAEYLLGSGTGSSKETSAAPLAAPIQARCRIVDIGHSRQLDLGIEIPASELQAVCSHEQWGEINERIVELIQAHRSTLIFVNTRRMAERLTHQLTQLLGENAVGSHHGSLSKEIRLDTEQRLKTGELQAVVATSSLELGIDVGYIDLVMQIGSPRAIAAFLQRIGRSGHALGLVPKGRLFALTRDELVECMALQRAVRAGRLDATPIPEAPLDILAQQIVAEVAQSDWSADELFALFRRAWPYQTLTEEQFERTLTMLADGLTDQGGRGRSLIYYDRIHRRLRGRRAARLLALSNGGAIAEIDTVRVVLEGENTVVGSVDEEFAVESNAGDIFLLGNSSWRIQRLRGNDLLVSDAQGAPPTIPFWRGEAPGRTLELSEEISRLREEIEQRLIQADQSHADPCTAQAPADLSPDPEPGDRDGEGKESHPARWQPIVDWLQVETSCSEFAARQIVTYLAAQRAAIGLVPTQSRIVFERFFDESGGMQLVVHAPFGGRINRGWGLAFRKRFCRSFDFELQATADDDGFILSLGPQHSFPIESLFPMMRTDNARNLLEQALLVVPMFHLRWRWNITRSLFVERMRNGKKVPPALQRFRSEDMLTAVFPKLTGCQENIVGDHEIPDHPLVQQTMADCLFEALDIDGLHEVLGRIESGEITLIARDTREPSPFAYELLNANPYAFLDGGEVQERRARAVATRRSLSVESVRDLGRLDPVAIEQVVSEARPEIRDADELHDLLMSRFLVPVDAAAGSDPAVQGLALRREDFQSWMQSLHAAGRAVELEYAPGQAAWVAVEAWPAVSMLYPQAAQQLTVQVPASLQRDWNAVDALNALLRGWVETSGPVTALELGALLHLPAQRIFAALEALEGEGLVLRGRFRRHDLTLDSQSLEIEWCHRRLLARIHRRTISGLRQEIEAVEPEIYLQYVARHQGALPGYRKSGVDGLHEVISQLQGLDIAAGAWEQAILPQRVSDYRAGWLDELCLSGDVGWGRLEPRQARRTTTARPMANMTRSIPVALFLRDDLNWLRARGELPPEEDLSGSAQDLLRILRKSGASFSTDLCQALQCLPSQLDDLLGELVSSGRMTADGFAGLRQLISSESREAPARRRGRYQRVRRRSSAPGRWTELTALPAEESDVVEEWAWQLLRRWGVIFRDLLQREPLAPAWWELLRVYRKLEARGEIRGGRFIRGVGGEQFATSEAIRELRAIRTSGDSPELLVLSAADPLNLTGMIGSGRRIPSQAGHLLACHAGQVVGWKRADEHWISSRLSTEEQQRLAMQFGVSWTLPPNVPSPAPAHSGTEAETRAQAEAMTRRGIRTTARAGTGAMAETGTSADADVTAGANDSVTANVTADVTANVGDGTNAGANTAPQESSGPWPPVTPTRHRKRARAGVPKPFPF